MSSDNIKFLNINSNTNIETSKKMAREKNNDNFLPTSDNGKFENYFLSKNSSL